MAGAKQTFFGATINAKLSFFAQSGSRGIMNYQALWEWLSNPSNQQTLAWIGGGVVAIACGVGAVFKSLHNKASTGTTVTADRGSIAAGRDAHVGMPPKAPRREKKR